MLYIILNLAVFIGWTYVIMSRLFLRIIFKKHSSDQAGHDEMKILIESLQSNSPLGDEIRSQFNTLFGMTLLIDMAQQLLAGNSFYRIYEVFGHYKLVIILYVLLIILTSIPNLVLIILMKKLLSGKIDQETIDKMLDELKNDLDD